MTQTIKAPNVTWRMRLRAKWLHWKWRKRRRVYDWSDRGMWGHNWSFLPDSSQIYGHLPRRPLIGDEFRSEMQSDKIGRFVAVEVEHCIDPPDMFFAMLAFVGYLEK